MKPSYKKNVSSIFLFFLVSFAFILLFQRLSRSKTSSVSFSHQLEPLVNLDLIDPNESKKIALNDNLVTFSGRFRDHLTDKAKERYRYLYLLDQNHDLFYRYKQLQEEIAILRGQAVHASEAFLFALGVSIPKEGFVVVPREYNYGDQTNAIIVHTVTMDSSIETLPQLRSARDLVRSGDENAAYQFCRELQKFLDFLHANVGIGNESMKQSLLKIETSLHVTLYHRDMSLEEKWRSFSQSFAEVEKILFAIFESQENGVHLYALRNVRNYIEYCLLGQKIGNNLENNAAQLQKARAKVGYVTWFFNNQEITSKALEHVNGDELHRWFKLSEKEWNEFPQNKGVSFRSPDQPWSVVLERTFRSVEPAPNYFHYFFAFLPAILIALFLYFIFIRQMKGIGSTTMNFGRSPAKLLQKGPRKTFADVAGIDEAREELEEMVEFLRSPEKFTKLGAKIPKGVLLIGPPGTGKTLIAKAVAGEAGVPFFSISGSDFVEMFVGVGASRVRDLFEQARKNVPCIIFIDEIDAVGRHRGSGLGGGHDEREQTLNQLLVEMDGMGFSEGIIIIAATNRPDVLDKALLRPGRFDRNVIVPLPDFRGRLAIAKVQVRNVKLAEDVSLKELASRTSGLSGADIENIINEGALIAAKKQHYAVTQEDLRYAQEKVVFGKERRSLEMEQEDVKTTSYHEAGHALIALFLQTSDAVTKVTRIPRGQSLGATHFEPRKQRVNYTKKELLDQMAVLAGGRVAEEIVNDNNPSSGAMEDIRSSTAIADAMVRKYGMSDLGLIDLDNAKGQSWMTTGAPSNKREYSDETARLVDHAIKQLIDEAYNRAKTIVKENFSKLEVIAEGLLKYETLEKEDLDKIMAGTFDLQKKGEEIEHELQKKPMPPPPPQHILKKRKGSEPSMGGSQCMF